LLVLALVLVLVTRGRHVPGCLTTATATATRTWGLIAPGASRSHVHTGWSGAGSAKD